MVLILLRMLSVLFFCSCFYVFLSLFIFYIRGSFLFLLWNVSELPGDLFWVSGLRYLVGSDLGFE